MAAQNPYGDDLGAVHPLDALADTPGRIRQEVQSWSDADFEGTYAPGKWSFRKVLVHLAQTELALPARARFALSQDGYVAQSFNQDDWMAIDNHASARAALDAYTTLRQFNLAMWRALTPEQVDRTFTHLEYGELTVGWIMAQMAGHDIHHLKQFRKGPYTKPHV
jgi:DinB superfamily